MSAALWTCPTCHCVNSVALAHCYRCRNSPLTPVEPRMHWSGPWAEALKVKGLTPGHCYRYHVVGSCYVAGCPYIHG